MVDPKDLHILVAVYKYRHFGKAAKEVGVSQPAITKSVQRLEKGFDFVLFDRSRSRVAPTALCDRIVTEAEAVLNRIAELERTARMLRGIEIGSLSIGVGPAMSESYVTQVVGWMAQEHPGIEIELRVDNWRHLSEWLVAGDIDLLVGDLADVADDDRFIVTQLPAQEFIWFCRKGHPLELKRKVTRLDLTQYPLATPRMPPWAIEWFREAYAEKVGSGTRVALPTIRCESYSTLKRIVSESDCVSVALAGTVHSEIEGGSLISLAVDAKSLATNAGIVQLQNRTASPLAVAFINKLEESAAQS